jgi:cis-L-3-hydroxyproline dehydratase
MGHAMQTMTGECVIPGTAAGPVLFADLGLSFMGGVDPATGTVTDVHHPLQGQNLAGTVLAIPSGRGSCSGSLLLFQLLMNGLAPAALVVRHKETILALGSMIAEELFQCGIPMIRLSADDFAALAGAKYGALKGGTIALADTPFPVSPSHVALGSLVLKGFHLTLEDEKFLAGEFGAAAQVAMRIMVRTARLEGATQLVDVDMAHIDGCFYQGPASLAFANKLLELGARVRIPATTNAICVDQRRWREHGIGNGLGLATDELSSAYVAMGVKPTFTCAPYLLSPAPVFGQRIAWGESNAVVFANSVLGARTLKYPDYLDILAALIGRAPDADCYRTEHRHATLHIAVPPPDPEALDDAYFPLLGYHIGKIATNEIPVITGLEGLSPTHDDLKAFGAAFATTSAAAMFHIVGITPEAVTVDTATGGIAPERKVTVTNSDLMATWREMNTATDAGVDLVSLGNPHFSLTEIAALAKLCAGQQIGAGVALKVTCGREVFQQAEAAGFVAAIRAFGGEFLNDTCWCFIGEPVVAPAVRTIATNSGKYAHYGPAATGKAFHFASLNRCVDAAVTGKMPTTPPPWLVG